jgi:hypothetical protein
VTHELRSVPQQSRERLTHILIGGGLGAVGLLLFVGFLLWKARRRGGPRKPPPGVGRPRRPAKKRRH